MTSLNNNNKGASVKASASNEEIVMSKVKIFPKYCETCSKGICEGYTAYDETVKLCQSCFDKDDEWQKDLKVEWDKYEKNNDYEPNTYRTTWTEFDWCEVFLANGEVLDLSEVFGDDFTDEQVEERYEVMYGE